MSGDFALIAAISAHIERRVGKIAFVFHELESDALHIDVHYVPASRQRPFDLLVTSGMSELPMTTPEAAFECRYAELVALLRPGSVLPSERHSWPVRMLTDLARYPHRNRTWLGCGHTVGDAESPPRPYAPGTGLTAVLLRHSPMLPARFITMKGPDRRQISFLAVVPLYEQELRVKLRDGTGALLARLADRGISDIIDPHRQCAVIDAGEGHVARRARARKPGPSRSPHSLN